MREATLDCGSASDWACKCRRQFEYSVYPAFNLWHTSNQAIKTI